MQFIIILSTECRGGGGGEETQTYGKGALHRSNFYVYIPISHTHAIMIISCTYSYYMIHRHVCMITSHHMTFRS